MPAELRLDLRPNLFQFSPLVAVNALVRQCGPAMGLNEAAGNAST